MRRGAVLSCVPSGDDKPSIAELVLTDASVEQKLLRQTLYGRRGIDDFIQKNHAGTLSR